MGVAVDWRTHFDQLLLLIFGGEKVGILHSKVPSDLTRMRKVPDRLLVESLAE